MQAVLAGFALAEAAIAVHVPGATVVFQVQVEQALQLLPQGWFLDRAEGFDATIQVARHPVGAADEHLGLSIVREPEDA